MSTSSPILPSNGKYDGTKKKPSLFERIRSRGSKKRSEADKRDSTPSPPSSSSTRGETEPEDSRVVTPMIPSKAGEVQLRKKSKFPHRDQITIDKAPTARESAFSGPPRYDWIDIETSAAIKVQSAFRRNKAMRELEEQGVSTAAMRNRARRRKARGIGSRDVKGTDDIPSLFKCCGVGLAFGDATEDYEAYRQHEKELYEERKKAREAHEAQLRAQYRKTHVATQSQSNKMEEAYEVVE